MQPIETICVVGLGYIGLPTAALLANRGYRVFGVDVNQHAVDTINEGRIHIKEPDLDTFVRAAVDSGRLTAATAAVSADVFIIAVPTPFIADHDPDLSYVEQATKSIAKFVRPGNIVILESTSPIGTTEWVEGLLQKAGADTRSLFIAHCPERVLPGRIMVELTENDRIVGGTTDDASEAVAAFYRTFVNGQVLTTNARTAEMTKLVENASRDVQIAFANELSMIAARQQIDVWELIRLANHHPRVNILQPGTGVGGHCIAVDPWFIVKSAPEDSTLIHVARQRNLQKTQWVIDRIANAVRSNKESTGSQPKLALMGLAFKPDIDDLRESPAVNVARALREDGISFVVAEPNIGSHAEFELTSPEAAVTDADIVVFLVAHTPFKSLETGSALVLDFCGVKTA